MRERIRWPWWLCGLIIALDISIVIAIWAGLGNAAAITSVLVLLALTIYFYIFSSLAISIDESQLHVGRAHIDRRYIGEIETLSDEQMRFLRGPGIDPSAFLAIRFWVKGGVKIEVRDQRDPTPYWLVSSRRPIEITDLLKN